MIKAGLLKAVFVAETAPRHDPIQLVARAAAANDPESAEIWTSSAPNP